MVELGEGGEIARRRERGGDSEGRRRAGQQVAINRMGGNAEPGQRRERRKGRDREVYCELNEGINTQ